MSRSVAIVNCAQIVTLKGPNRPRVGGEFRELSIVEDGALLSVDGRIEYVGTRSGFAAPSDALLIDAGGRVVLPGFVDAHTHLVFAGNRAEEFAQRAEGASYEEIAARGGGILSTVRKTRSASLEELVAEGRRHLGWMMRNGTTTVEAKSGYGQTIEDELKILLAYRRLNEEGPIEIVPTLLAPHALPSEYGGRCPDYLQEVALPLLRRAKEEGLAEFADAFVEEGYFAPEELEPFCEEARRLGLGLRLHVDQLREGGGAAWAARQVAKTADHLEQASDSGIIALREAGTMAVLLPGSVFGLRKAKYPDARKMIDEGVPVVLATDFNPGSSPVASMPLVLSLACTQMGMSPEETIVAATLNAAHSLKRGDDRGSIEPGKRADFVIHDVSDYREIPYWIGRHTAWKVFVRGEELLSNDSESHKLA